MPEGAEVSSDPAAPGGSLDYWRTRLAGLEPLELPHDHARRVRAARRDPSGDSMVRFTLPREQSEALKALASSRHATLSMVLMAVFQTLLMRYSGQTDVAVAVSTGGRHRAGPATRHGRFAGMLVMRTDLSGDPPFVELLGRVRGTSLEAHSHRDLPFDVLARHLEPEPQADRRPLCQVAFALRGATSRARAAGPCTRQSGPRDDTRPGFDLDLFMTEDDGDLRAWLAYDASLFDRATIERMAAHLRNLIDAVVQDPHTRLSALPLMGGHEREQLLVGFNDTARPYPLHQTLHQLFEQQAARIPEAVAVVSEDLHLTYAELDARANRLAHHLRSLGIQPDVLVGICMHRCPELVVAMLAVLKAGGAYLPIDPDYPPERIAFMLADSAAPVVLASGAALARLPQPQRACAVVLDDTQWQVRAEALPEHRPEPLAAPQHLAYVIYTSGSTGRPKGVMIPHRGVCNHVFWLVERIGLTAADRVLQKTSVSFDASVPEFFAPLSVGGTVILASAEGEKDTGALVEAIRRDGVTVFQSVPSALRVLLQEPSIDTCGSLRYVVSGGEALDRKLAREFQRRLPHARLGNFYGPTEASIDAASVDVAEVITGGGAADVAADDATATDAAATETAEPLPIGRPVANARVYVLDAHRQPVPIGVPGELYIGGAGLARGYLNRPELTAERFVDDPFTPGERLYRTGDLVRWRPDGLIGFIGRTDHQVKIRGFRIELGEVEAALRACSGVEQATVVAREGEAVARLVGYVVPETLDAEALRESVKAQLPDYMVPSVIMAITAMPTLPNGKLDRKALPAPDWTARQTLRQEPPQGATEQALAEIWGKVLGVPGIGRHDNFFELGGHSLSATQAMARLRSVMDVALPLRTLFEAPTVAELAARVHAARGDTPTDQQPPLAARDHDIVEAPLSYSQEALWFLDRLAGPHGAYNIAMSARLAGAIRPEALERALQALVERHDALRTAFDDREGEPLQRVMRDATITLPLESLEAIVGDAREQALARRMREQALAAFDLSHAPLMRARLYRLAPDDHALLIVVHHIVSDGWSCALMAQELGTLYGAFERGEQPALPALPLRFGDFAAWQRACGEASMQHSLARWRERLAGLEPLELPTDFPRPPQPSGSGNTVEFTIPPEQGRALRRLAREHNATLYMVLLAAFQTLLMRHSGQTDIAVGTSVAGRSHPELEGLFGFFVNALVMRTDLSGDPAFAGLLERVRERSLDDYAHEVPFDVLVRHLNPERLLDRNPVYQVAFVLQNLPDYDLAIGGVPAWLEDVDNGTAKFDLALEMFESADGLQAYLTYSTDLFERSTIERMAAHLRNLIDAIVENPDTRLSALPLMGSDERDQLLIGFNDTARPYPLHKTLHQLFEEQVALTPEATAVVFEHTRLDYASLDAQANRLAHHLRSLGVGPDVLVGVCMHRCPEIVVAMLAVLKAGGAYVPIDPEYPSERITFMLEDCAAPVVLATEAALTRLPQSQRGRAIVLDGSRWPALADALPAHSPEPLCGPEHLAYVIYTSGSTGRPKGAMIPHRGVTNHVFWLIERLALGPADRLLQKTTISFDASVWEFFAPLAVGAPVVLARPGGEKDTEYLAHAIREQGITILQMVPSALRVLLQEPLITSCESLRYVVSGGEALDWELAGEFERRLPRARLGNMYGPSEASDDTTSVDVAEVHPGLGPVPIGRPIANARVYVLDAHRRPVPLGVPGELYIGGAGLARGYLNRPELTDERFVDDPFTPGERLYRTGDLVRWRPDGLIGFIGRTDHQVKIRGFRIELGEIENALKTCAGVRNGAVIVHEDRPGNRRLVAYVEGADLEPARVRAELAARLPDYMVPQHFVVLSALPLLPNGKLDRKALPAPEAGTAPGADFVAPRSPIEQTLADIWADVLGGARVGVHDNFFDLGGHSLSATQAMARLRSVMGVALPLRTLFEAPTVAELTTRVHANLGDMANDRRTPLAAGMAAPNEHPPASSAQQALWTIDRLNGPSGLYNIPLAIRLTGELDAQALAQALQAFVDRHPALRTCFGQDHDVPVQIVAPRVDVELPIVDVSTDALDAEIDRLTEAPFDLEHGPLLRARLLRLSATDHVFVFAVHHIVADGWSIGLLTRELPLLYRHAHAGGQPALPPPSRLDFRDYAVWQQQWLASDAARTSLAWWREQLAGLEPLELPTDLARPRDGLLRGDALELIIPAERLAGLKALARSTRATLHMVLLAAFETLLMRHSGQHDFAVGTPVAGRDHVEIENVFGMFVNMLAMRADLSGDPDFTGLVERVRQTALAAYSHQDIPFDRIVTEINPAREANRNPLFQVSFSVDNTPPTPFKLPGITARPVAGHSESAKFDLSLAFVETGAELHGTLEYSTDLFERSTIERMAAHLRNLIDAIVENPDTRLSALPLMGSDERDQLLVRFNDTARPYPLHKTLHQLFEEQVALTPEATAVVFEHTRLDYASLDAQANRLAHHLRSIGVGPDVLVGVCMHRCPEIVVAMLAVLKAGGAYVPIDPEYPSERIAFMLEDSAAPVVLATEAALARLPQSQRGRAIVLDGSRWPVLADALPAHSPEPLCGPEHLAYVIYTSGSTGRPKGAMIPHRGVTRLVCNTDYVRIGPGDCVAHASNPSFDAATFEIWGALLNGAHVAIVPSDVLLSAPELRRRIAEDRIDTMFLTTALFNEHAANAPDTFSELRDLLVGGESASPPAIARVLRKAPHTRLLNVYGPTETTTFATWFELPHAFGDGDSVAEAVPIGHPIANTHCHVLDASMQPVPIGVVGELWIGGPGLARGYLNRPELTDERFVDDPFVPGERLYRTGDRARRRADGALVFCGRGDDQVKIRGFRIELGEVRAAVAALPGVRQQEVIVREDAPGDRRLTAYIVWDTEVEPPDAAELRATLADRLPSFMMPAAFVAVDALPMTPNGKLDRAALPAPSPLAHATGGNAEDGDEFERQLRTIWESVLGIPDIALDADFFDLGGHSMLAVRLLAEVERRTGTRLRTASFFQAPTIRRFATLLRNEAAPGTRSCVVTIREGDGKRPLFFVSGWGGQLIVLNELAKELHPAQSFHVLDTGAFEAGEAALTIEQVAATMIGDMRRVQPHGPYRLAGYSMGGAIVYEIAQQLRQRGEDVALLALLDCTAPGYPRRRSAPMRVLLHLRRAATMKPAQMLAYLAGRARWMIRNLRETEKSLFENSDIEETTFTRTLEHSARAMLDAWDVYQFRPYAGRVMLVRAETTPKRVGDIDDDPTYGWAALTGGVDLRSMQCTHVRMLFPPHAADLARILGDAIAPDAIRRDDRNGAMRSQPATRCECIEADA